MPSNLRAVVAAAASTLALVACGPRTFPSGAETPRLPVASNGSDVAVVESVRAYLQTFHLNERELPTGLTIPWQFATPEIYAIGAARVTGRLGPGGHQIYEVTEFDYKLYVANDGRHAFLEIAPQ